MAALADLVGRELGKTDWIEISQEQIDAFAEATGDRQWIHCDVERAQRESPFKSTIAHGYLTVALTPALLPKLLLINNCETVINTGIAHREPGIGQVGAGLTAPPWKCFHDAFGAFATHCLND